MVVMRTRSNVRLKEVFIMTIRHRLISNSNLSNVALLNQLRMKIADRLRL
jgi:hypothetical protein